MVLRQIARCLVLGSFLAFGSLFFGGCGDDDGGVPCCMLRDLGTACTQSNSSSSLVSSAAEWRNLGENGDKDACQAYLNAEEVGCSGGYGTGRTEAQAAIACAE